MSHIDLQNTDVEELSREGIPEGAVEISKHEALDGAQPTSSSTQSGTTLSYEELSDEDAVLLRRTLSTKPPVRHLNLSIIWRRSLKIAFDGLAEIPSLRKITLQGIDCEGKDLGIAGCQVFRSLRSLDLGYVKAGIGFWKDVASYIRQNHSLEELRISDSCGGDEGMAAIIDALTGNDTLKKFTLGNMAPIIQECLGDGTPPLSFNAWIGFSEMLASNSTLELVDVREAFRVQKEDLSSLLAQERHAGVFKRLLINWTEQLLPELTELLRKEAYHPKLYVRVTGDDEGALREFFDAAAAKQDAPRAALSSRLRPVRPRWCPYRRSVQLTDVLFKSLVELLAVNKTLDYVSISDEWGPGPWLREVGKVTQALRTNYTLTRLYLNYVPEFGEEPTTMRGIELLLARNVRLVERAAEFVLSGADVGDEEGVDVLKKVQASARLVEKVRCTTGETEEAAMERILSALTRVSV
ncbi:hypothetical protein MTO96_046933 [Rhipicephalus appendiculatus]